MSWKLDATSTNVEEPWKQSASILCWLPPDGETHGETHKARNRSWLRFYLQARLFKKYTHLRGTVKKMRTWKQPYQPGGEGEISKQKGATRLQHAGGLTHTSSLIVPVMERDG